MIAPEDWRREREHLAGRVAELRCRGICPSCYDLATGELYGARPIVYEDDLFRV